MQVILFILLILFGIILFLFLDILFYTPGHLEETTDHQDNTEEIPLLSEDSYEECAEDNLRTVNLLWPEISPFLKTVVLNHMQIFIYHRNEKADPAVFIMENDENIHAFFTAANAQFQKDLIQQSFIAAIPLARRYRFQAVSELDEWMKEHEIHPSFVLSEGSDNEDLSGNGRFYSLVGTVISAEMRIKAEGNNAAEWQQHITREIFPIHFRRDILDIFNHHLPWQIRLEEKLPHFQSKAVRDFLALMPKCSLYFQAQCLEDNDSILLRAANDDDLQEAYAQLEKDALKYHVSLAVQKRRRAVRKDNHQAFQRIKKAVSASFIVEDVIPSLIPYKQQMILVNENQVWYMPFNEGRKESAQAAVLFYMDLLN